MIDVQIQNSMFIILLTTGIIIWIIGIIVKRNQPKKINKIYGYRTKRSMKSQEAWGFAQEYSTNLLIGAAKVICVAGLAMYYIRTDEFIGGIIATMVIVIILAVPIIMTERALKDKFD